MQEQAWSVARNLAEDEAGIEMVFQELGPDNLLNQLMVALKSKNDDILLQVRMLQLQMIFSLISGAGDTHTCELGKRGRCLSKSHFISPSDPRFASLMSF